MSLKNGTIKTGASGLTVVGGTDLVLTSGPSRDPKLITVVAAADTDYRLRRFATFNFRGSNVSAGIPGKCKATACYYAPKLTADGRLVMNLIRIETEWDPETTVAEELELRMCGGQLISDTDYQNFWKAGSYE